MEYPRCGEVSIRQEQREQRAQVKTGGCAMVVVVHPRNR